VTAVNKVIDGLRDYCESFTKRKGDVYDTAFMTRSRKCDWTILAYDACCNFLKFDKFGAKIVSQTAVTITTGEVVEFGAPGGGPYYMYKGPVKSGKNAKPRPLMLDMAAAQDHPNYSFEKWVYTPTATVLNQSFHLYIKLRQIPRNPVMYFSLGKCGDQIDFSKG